MHFTIKRLGTSLSAYQIIFEASQQYLIIRQILIYTDKSADFHNFNVMTLQINVTLTCSLNYKPHLFIVNKFI